MHKYVLSLHASPKLCQGSLLKSQQVGEAALTITKFQGRNRILLSLPLNPSQLPRGTCTHSAILASSWQKDQKTKGEFICISK